MDLTDVTEVDVYLRLSYAPDGSTMACDRQLAELTTEMIEPRGWTVRHVFMDNDLSATDPRVIRTDFEKLLKVQPKRPIATWHSDRFIRVNKDLERVIELGVNVYALRTGHLDLSTPAGRAVARTVTAWAQYEGEQKAERQKSAHRQRAALGKPWWALRPFGFEKDGALRDDEASALRAAYMGVLQGETLRGICQRLNDAGFATNKGNPWRPETLGPVLKNPRNAALSYLRGKYMGMAAYGAIVTEDVWRATCSILNDPSRRSGAGRSPVHLLTGFARCGKCDGQVKVESRKGYKVYACRVGHCCSIRQEFADGRAWLELVRAVASGHVDSWKPTQEIDTAALAIEAAALRQRLNDLAADYGDGEISRAQLQAGTQRINLRLSEVESKMGVAEQEGLSSEDVEALFEDIDGMDSDRQRALIRRGLESVTLWPTGRGRRPGADNVTCVPRGRQ